MADLEQAAQLQVRAHILPRRWWRWWRRTGCRTGHFEKRRRRRRLWRVHERAVSRHVSTGHTLSTSGTRRCRWIRNHKRGDRFTIVRFDTTEHDRCKHSCAERKRRRDRRNRRSDQPLDRWCRVHNLGIVLCQHTHIRTCRSCGGSGRRNRRRAYRSDKHHNLDDSDRRSGRSEYERRDVEDWCTDNWHRKHTDHIGRLCRWLFYEHCAGWPGWNFRLCIPGLGFNLLEHQSLFRRRIRRRIFRRWSRRGRGKRDLRRWRWRRRRRHN